MQCLKCYNLIDEINALEIYLNGNLNCYKWKTDKGLGKNAVFLINLKIIEGKNVGERSAMLLGCGWRMKILSFNHFPRETIPSLLLRGSFRLS